MRRRAFLTTVGLAALSGRAGGQARAHPTGDGPATPTDGDADALGHVDLPDARESVLSADGRTAFVAREGGLTVVDVSDPRSPAVLATRSVWGDHPDGPLAGIWDIAIDGDRVLLVGPAHGSADLQGAALVDVSDPASPRQVRTYETDHAIHNCALAGSVAYLTGTGAPGSPLVVVDLAAVAELARWSVLDADDAWADVARTVRPLHDVTVRDGRAYLAYWDAGTWILDVSDPADPTVVSRVRGREPSELATLDQPGREATELPGNDHTTAVGAGGDLLAVGAEAWDADGDGDGGPGGITLYDIADPTAPAELATIPAPPTPDPSRDGTWTTAHNFSFRDGRLYSAWYDGGVRIHDVTDPTAPVERYAGGADAPVLFWTALPGRDCVVASGLTALEGGRGALYAFPDPTAARTEVATAAPTGTGVTSDDAAGGPASGERGTATSDAAGPGFGALASLAGLGVAAWRARRGE